MTLRNSDLSFTEETKIKFQKELEITKSKIHPYHQDQLTLDHDTQTVNIMLTEQCNFRCDYCYEKFTNDIIEDETLKKTIEFLYKSNSDRIDFWLFGGEITTVPKKILAAVNYITSLKKHYKKDSVRIIFFTNGYIFDEVLWARVQSMLLGTDIDAVVQISFDGLGKMNYARKSLAKKETNDRVKENIFKFNQYVRVIVRSTISPQNLYDDNSILETAQWLERNGISEYAINLVQESHWDQDKAQILIRQMDAVSNWLKEYYDFNPYRKFVIFPFDMILTRTKKGCGVGSGFLSANTKGELSPCHVLYSYAKLTNTQDNKIWGFVGNVNEGINKIKTKDFVDLDKEKIEIPQCKTCPSTVCSVCPAVSATTYGDLTNTWREGYCVMMVKLQYIIEDFKKYLESREDIITAKSDWVFLNTIWQHIWLTLSDNNEVKPRDTRSFNSYYIMGGSPSYAKFELKKSLLNFLGIDSNFSGIDLNNNLLSVLKKISEIFDIPLPEDDSLNKLLEFSGKIYYKIKENYENNRNRDTYYAYDNSRGFEQGI
jgi:sulfatase maturation enzyme AslB (radical SAM superfamily)